MVNDATPKVSIIIPTKDRSSDVNLCVESILNSDYQNIEVIVVDNGSEDNTVDKLKKNILDTRLKIFPVGRNLGAGGGRNYGASKADGEYYLFIDDDNEIKPTLVGFLVDSFENRTDCCQIGPLMFYKGTSDLIWCKTCKIDFYSSKAVYEETGDLYDGSIEVVESGHLPNCFMVLAGDFETIGGFDEKYVVMYEEADFSYRMQKATGKKCLVDLRAHTYHNTELAVTSGGVAHSPVYIFPSTDRAFLTARNRVYFMRKNVSFIQYSIFVFFYLPQIFLFYQFHMLISKKFKMAYRYLLGTLRGFVL